MGGQTLNTASAMGRFFLNVMAGFAELERNLIAERTAAALAHKKRHRQAYGPTPYGFDRCGDSLVVNEEEWQLVYEIKALRKAGMSLRGIAHELNLRDVPTKSRGGVLACFYGRLPLAERTLRRGGMIRSGLVRATQQTVRAVITLRSRRTPSGKLARKRSSDANIAARYVVGRRRHQ